MNDDETAIADADDRQLPISLNKSDRRQTPRSIDRRSGINAAKENEARNIVRDKLLKTREYKTQLRETIATSREQVVGAAEALYAEVDEHMAVLQQANSKLVIATITATQLAEKLEITKAELEITKDLAEKANLAKSDFLSSMSHELRTPLNAILGFAQLLESGSPTPTDSQGKKLNHITKAGWYLLELINQILELAVIESGKLSVQQEKLSLQEILWECQVMIGPQLLEKNIALQIAPFDPTLTVIADKTRLKQVIYNFLSNAIKYNKNDGSIDVLCALNNSGKISISVKDSGIGLSKEKLDQLFQPFNRLGQEKGLNQGTGIGLMISKQLVELMGGTIGVKSTEGIGTEFWIEFDCANALEMSNVIPNTLQSTSQNKLINIYKTLLYVEDNPANLMLVENIIIERCPNIKMLTASEGKMGIALAQSHRPDVILLDINLPDLSGFEVLQLLKNNPLTANIPVVAISANAMPHDRDRALKAGFCTYLTKPIKINEFLVELSVILKQ